MPEATIEQLEDACSADPGCAGFNSNGWLKSAIDEEDKWYDSDGDLFVKVYDEESPVLLQKRKEEPEPPEAFDDEEEGTSGQSDKATEVIEMMAFILVETEKEEDEAHTTELEAQHAFEDEITELKSQEAATLEVIAELEEQLAKAEKELLETKADHAA